MQSKYSVMAFTDSLNNQHDFDLWLPRLNPAKDEAIWWGARYGKIIPPPCLPAADWQSAWLTMSQQVRQGLPGLYSLQKEHCRKN